MSGRWWGVLAAVLVPLIGHAEPVRAHYEAYAAGLPVLAMDAVLDLSPQRYRLELELQTEGAAALFSSMRMLSTADGRFDAGVAVPQRYYSAGTMRGEKRLTLVDYRADQPSVQQLEPPNEQERDAVPPSLQRNTVDTLSAMAQLIERVNRTGRCEGTARTFDGRRVAELRAWTIGDEVLPGAGRDYYAGPALHCAFQGRQLAGFRRDESRASQEREQAGSAWFAAPVPGGPSYPVRISFHTRWFGDATMYLRR